jgi:hypothetical protein
MQDICTCQEWRLRAVDQEDISKHSESPLMVYTIDPAGLARICISHLTHSYEDGWEMDS